MSTEREMPQATSGIVRHAEETPSVRRQVSVDAYRGFVMLLMISAGFNIPKVAANFPDHAGWQFLAHQTEHAIWRGCTLWDLIQPSFMFIVGVAVPYSLAARRAHNERFISLFAHALWRSFALIALGIFLASTGRPQTSFSFAIVLAQIGFGYPFLWLLAWTRLRTQLLVLTFILAGYWTLFAVHPLPPPAFNFQSVGLPADWHFLTGFEGHWEKNANAAAAFDRWFLNLFPQEKPFVFNAGGYQTLNFVPSLATMILGLLAGQLLRSSWNPARKFGWLIGTGLALLLLGVIWDLSGLGPMVKRIWTPSFALFSGGWALLLLAFFYGVIDAFGYRRWAFPLVVAGMNSIALYCLSMLLKPWIRERLKLHLGKNIFETLGPTFAPMLEMFSILLILWLISFWLYRRKIFLRI